MLRQANPPVWLLELKDDLLRQYGSSARELVELLQSSGFDLATYDANRGQLSFSAAPWEDHGNVLAIHRTALDRVQSRLAARAMLGMPTASSRSPRN